MIPDKRQPATDIALIAGAGFESGPFYSHLADELKDQCYRICKKHITKIPPPSEGKHKTIKTKERKVENEAAEAVHASTVITLLRSQRHFGEVDIALLRVSAGTLWLQCFSSPVCCSWHLGSGCACVSHNHLWSPRNHSYLGRRFSGFFSFICAVEIVGPPP